MNIPNKAQINLEDIHLQNALKPYLMPNFCNCVRFLNKKTYHLCPILSMSIIQKSNVFLIKALSTFNI